MFNFQKRHSPLQKTVTLSDIGGSAIYLLSDLSAGVTGEVHYVDSGYNIISTPRPDMLQDETIYDQRLSPKNTDIFSLSFFVFVYFFQAYCWTHLPRSLQGHFPDLCLSLSILIFLYHQNQSILQTHHHFHLPHL